MKSILVIIAITLSTVSLRAQVAPAPDFESLEDVIKLIPRDVIKDLKQPSKIETARRTANDVLQNGVVNKTVTFELELGERSAWAGGENTTDKIQVATKDMPVDIGGLDFIVRLWVMMPQDQEAVLDKQRPGAEVKVTGKLTRFAFTAASGKLFLDGDLRQSRLDP